MRPRPQPRKQRYLPCPTGPEVDAAPPPAPEVSYRSRGLLSRSATPPTSPRFRPGLLLRVVPARPGDVHAGGEAQQLLPPSEEVSGHPVLVPAGRDLVDRPGCCLLQWRQPGLEALLRHGLPVRGCAEPGGLGGGHLRQGHREGRAEDVQLVQEAAHSLQGRPRPSGGPAARHPGRERGGGEGAVLRAGLRGGAALGHRLLAPPHPERRHGPPQVSLRQVRGVQGCPLEPSPVRWPWQQNSRAQGERNHGGDLPPPLGDVRGPHGDLSWTGLGWGQVRVRTRSEGPAGEHWAWQRCRVRPVWSFWLHCCCGDLLFLPAPVWPSDVDAIAKLITAFLELHRLEGPGELSQSSDSEADGPGGQS